MTRTVLDFSKLLGYRLAPDAACEAFAAGAKIGAKEVDAPMVERAVPSRMGAKIGGKVEGQSIAD